MRTNMNAPVIPPMMLSGLEPVFIGQTASEDGPRATFVNVVSAPT